MSSLGNQNQLQLSLAPLGELLKTVMLLSNFNGFNFPPYPFGQKFMQKKGSPSKSPIWKEKDPKWFLFFSNLLHGLCCGLSQSSCHALLVCLFLLCFMFYFLFIFLKKSEKYKNSVCFVYTITCVPWMTFETKFSNFVSLVA